jgi:hypothetical protein
MDVLRLLSSVAHLQAQEAGSDLKDIAETQKKNIAEKRQARDLSKLYDQITSDDAVTADELGDLRAFAGEMGIDTSGMDLSDFEVVGDGVVNFDNTTEHAHHRRNQQGMEAIKGEIDGLKDDLEDNQSLLQFEIQMATSDMQNAESTRSQAEKRMADHRKEMLRNWAG